MLYLRCNSFIHVSLNVVRISFKHLTFANVLAKVQNLKIYVNARICTCVHVHAYKFVYLFSIWLVHSQEPTLPNADGGRLNLFTWALALWSRTYKRCRGLQIFEPWFERTKFELYHFQESHVSRHDEKEYVVAHSFLFIHVSLMLHSHVLM